MLLSVDEYGTFGDVAHVCVEGGRTAVGQGHRSVLRVNGDEWNIEYSDG